MLTTRASGASSSALLSGARPLQDDLCDGGLLETHELSRAFERSTLRLLALASGRHPLIVRRVLYDEDSLFKGMFDGWQRRSRAAGARTELVGEDGLVVPSSRFADSQRGS